MNLRDQLARVIARDSRYTIESYAFVLESLKRARTHKLQELRKRRDRDRDRASRPHKRASPRLRLRLPGRPRPSNRAMSPAAKSARPPGAWHCVITG